MLRILLAVSAIGLLLCGPASVVAHHSFAAEFLPDETGTISGVVTQVWFKNPHARYYIEVSDDDGQVVTWDTRANSPSLLVRKGWTKESIKVGDQVTVHGYLGRDGRKLMSIITVTFPDGTVLRDKQEEPN
ncbi:MAG: hypothetical protein KJO31_13735 [Gammaproteobacteria bacterium]|nr:hypothetical protein [Gammaproteobacteria bacterium]